MSGSNERPPYLGFGLGLRTKHYNEVLDGEPRVDWFEVLSENYMDAGGQPRHILNQIAERFPVVIHGVSLSIASTAELDIAYLTRLKHLADEIQPKWISDHLCWTGVHGINLHDLLPFPYTREALDHIADRVCRVQEFLDRRIALENVSTYVTFNESEMTEWEFISELAERADCWLLFDVNNVYVSAFNHGYDAKAFIDGIPAERVVQLHVAGHDHMGTHIIDTHDHQVCDDVWDLYRYTLERIGPVSTMIERDDCIPRLQELVAELDIARNIAADTLAARAGKAAAE